MSWDTLAQMRERPRTATENPTETELAELCAATFGTPKGSLLIAKLRKLFVEKRVAPASLSESALLVAEAERQFVLRLEDLAVKGEQRNARRSSKPS